MTPIGPLHAEKLSEAVLLYVLINALPVSLFVCQQPGTKISYWLEYILEEVDNSFLFNIWMKFQQFRKLVFVQM